MSGYFITPNPTPAPEGDLALDAIFQATFAEITGLDGTMVRPRWQATPPKQPEQNQDWMALGTTILDADDGPLLETENADPGSTRYVRWEQLTVLVTTYGPNAYGNMSKLRDGLCIASNREVLASANIGFVSTGNIRPAPELINQIWVRRHDMIATFRRRVERVYGVHTLTSATVHLVDDTHVDDTIQVTPP